MLGGSYSIRPLMTSSSTKAALNLTTLTSKDSKSFVLFACDTSLIHERRNGATWFREFYINNWTGWKWEGRTSVSMYWISFPLSVMALKRSSRGPMSSRSVCVVTNLKNWALKFPNLSACPWARLQRNWKTICLCSLGTSSLKRSCTKHHNFSTACWKKIKRVEEIVSFYDMTGNSKISLLLPSFSAKRHCLCPSGFWLCRWCSEIVVQSLPLWQVSEKSLTAQQYCLQK